MLITGASYQGGVDQTTTAVHLAASLHTLAPTLQLGGDDNRHATAWTQRGKGFPFKVAEEVQAVRYTRDLTPTGIDTGRGPTQVDLQALSRVCDLLSIPAAPASLDTDGLVLTRQALQDIGNDPYRRQHRRRGRKLV
jgi:chromosome partitioning protein